MTWHLEILAKRQQRVLAEIGPNLTRRGFYLAGGTAVALHLGHRRSVDFDWFTSEGLDDPLQLAEELQQDGIAFVTDQVAQGTLHGSVCGVRVSLLRYRYPLLARTRLLNRETRIAARPDLAAMKLSAVAQRGAKKDFVDIYALGKRSMTLDRMLQYYREKYSVEDLAHLLYSLAYFADADRDRLPRILWDVNWRTMKTSIQLWVRGISEST
jgi:hypothetical protein